MDILKYLDVLIGLAVVMVMLSPAVTAVTQLVMWSRNKRSEFLRGGIADLIGQLDARPAAWIDFTSPPNGAVVPDVSVAGVTGAVPSGPRLFLENGIDPASAPGGTLTLTCSTRGGARLANANVTLTFLPRGARDVQQVRSAKSDAKGETTVEYVSNVVGYGSSRANVVVLDGAGAQVAATVDCAVDDNNVALTTSATGSAVFVHPGGIANGAPGRYSVKCTIRVGGQPAQNHVIVFDFLRNTEADVRVQAGPTNAAGQVNLLIPPQLMAPAITPAQAAELANAVLSHPMIRKGPAHRAVAWLPKWLFPVLLDRNGDVVEREELIRLLLELADAPVAGASLQPATADVLRRALFANGIPSPGRTLSQIRTAAQALEHDKPSDAQHVRQAKAIIEAAQSDFVGKINNWFDQTMSRVIQRYAGYAKFVTVLSAAIVAFVLQFDSLELLRRLSVDNTLRSALIEEGKAQQAKVEAQAKEAEAKAKEADAKAKAAAEAKDKEAKAKADANAAAGTKAGTDDKAADATKAASDAAKANVTSDEDLAAAKAKRDEIDATLAKLRGPNLSIIPDHFVWQRVPQARLDRNPLWTSPYPARFELVAGGSTYAVMPRWRRDVLTDLKPAIEASGAPVRVDQVADQPEVLLVAKEPVDPKVSVSTNCCPTTIALTEIVDFAEARLAVASIPKKVASDAGTNATQQADESIDREKDPPVLVVDDQIKPIPFKATPATLVKQLQGAIDAAKLNVSTREENGELVIVAKDAQVKDLALRWNADDPFSDVLTKPRRAPRAWLLKHAELERATRGTVSLQIGKTTYAIKPEQWTTIPGGSQQSTTSTPPSLPRTIDVPRLVEVINAMQSSVVASVHQAGALVLTARRLGPIQLRYQTGHAETNILNAATDVSWQVMAQLLQPSLVGVIVSWALLSLGAPFWYDMLKNLLKLRPAPAIAEEKQRQDRAKEDAPAKK